MSYMKDLFMDKIYELSDKTGYDVEFLLDRYKESDGDWKYFVGVTMERDW